jgi:hypothetical protein
MSAGGTKYIKSLAVACSALIFYVYISLNPGISCEPFFKEDPEERRKEMSGRKEAFWALFISAALITAGLILSCGDDDGTAVICQEACAKLKLCSGDNGDDYLRYFGETEAGCLEVCEEVLAGAKGELLEAFKCIPDVHCEAIVEDCFCLTICDRLNYCVPGLEIASCIDECENEDVWAEILCHFRFSSCQFILGFCEYYED